jgi:hypothetical protein
VLDLGRRVDLGYCSAGFAHNMVRPPPALLR